MKKTVFGILLTMLLMSMLVLAFNSVSLEADLRSQLDEEFENFTKDVWEESVVIGDAYRIEFYDYLLDNIKNEFKLEALHNSVQAWIQYCPWTLYPSEWDNIKRLVEEAHNRDLPVGSVFGLHTVEKHTLPIEEPWGFIYYYQEILPDEEKWRYPNGSIAKDPHLVGDTRSFSDRLVWRTLDYEDSYTIMQPQNPYWLSFLIEWAEKNLNQGVNAIFLDGVDGAFPMFWNGGWGDNTTWEGLAFIGYLKSKIGPNDTTSLGIDNFDNFCMRDYLRNEYSIIDLYGTNYTARGVYELGLGERVVFENPSQLMEDPIVKNYIIFQYSSLMNFTSSLVDGIKSYATTQNKEVFLTTNNGDWIPFLLVAPYYDATYLECGTNFLPPYQRNMRIYKAGMAASSFSKPVWMCSSIIGGIMHGGAEYPYAPYGPPENAGSIMKIYIAEGFASGGLFPISFWFGTDEEGWPPRRLIEGSERESIANYGQFLSSHKYAFEDVQSTSKVAVVLSVPSMIWDYFPAIGIDSLDRHELEFQGWTRILEELHISYDVLMFGMQSIFDDSKNLERLNNYDLLIVPDSNCMSDEQIHTLSKYLAEGGVLLATPNMGLMDEMKNLRDPAELQSIWNSVNTHSIEYGLGFLYEESSQVKSPDVAIFNKIASKVLEIIPPRGRISTNATSDVLTNILFNPAMGGFEVHLVNYDYDFNNSVDWTVEKENIRMKIPIPEDFDVNTVRVISPDFSEELTLDFNYTEDFVEFTVPELKVWDIILLESEMRTDLNKDGTVNIVDVSIVAIAFGTKEGDEKYDPIADMDGNQQINIVDVSIVAIDYGKTV